MAALMAGVAIGIASRRAVVAAAPCARASWSCAACVVPDALATAPPQAPWRRAGAGAVGPVRALCTTVAVGTGVSDLPPRILALNTIRNNPGSRKAKRRVGRGPGSGRGKTSTRGHKGQRARSGGSVALGFEGGQTPLHIRVPKRGFSNKKFKRVYTPLGLEKLQHWIDTGRLDATQTITLKEIFDSGIVGKFKHGVALVGNNSKALTTPVTIEVSRASDKAIRRIEEVGGTVTSVYHSPLALRALLKPHKFDFLPKAPRPKPKQMKYYVDDSKRGYLSRHVQLRDLKASAAAN